MSRSCRRFLLLVITFAALSFFPSDASAQLCNEVCDPYTSGCDDYCERCLWWQVDGYCGATQSSTCGGNFGNGPCIPSTCSPNWVETGRQNRGTYDGNSFSGCTHHRVDWVTITDSNQCNRSSYYWTQSYCQDWIDSSKNGCCWPSCCSGYGDNGVPLSCNGQHSC
jgi:hypothetical protein